MEHGQLLRQYEGGSMQLAGEGDVFPIFTREAVHNETKSLAAGRPMFDTVEHLQIIIPGDPGASPVRIVSEEDKVRFAQAYERFKREEEHVFDGTILESWSMLNKAQVAGLKAMGIHTLEALANISDGNLPRLGMGGMMLRDQARAVLETAKVGHVPARLVQENAQLRTQIDTMGQTISELKVMIEKMARENKVDVSQVTTPLDNAMSHARETLAGQPGDLPEGWQTYKLKELIELCQALGSAVTPRNRDEALKLLSEYQGTRDALKK